MASTGSPTEEDTSRRIESKRLTSDILWKVHVGMVLVQVGYASSNVINKVALTNGVNPIVFAVYRDAICLVVLLPLAFFVERGKRTSPTIQVMALFVALGFTGTFMTQLMTLYGLSLTSAAYASTVPILTPLFTFIISASFGFEQIRWNRLDGQAKLGGLLSAVSGAVILAIYLGPVVLGHVGPVVHTIPSSDLDSSGLLTRMLMYINIGPWHLGILCLFLAAFTLSISISIQVPILAAFPAPITVSALAYLLGAIMLFTTALLTVNDWSALVITEKSAVIAFVYSVGATLTATIGLVPAAFNFTVLVWSVQKAGPVLVSSYVPLQLFAAAAMGYMFLGESIYLGSVLGALLIIIGLGFITWGQVKSRTVSALPIKADPSLDGIPVTTAAYSLEEPLLGFIHSFARLVVHSFVAATTIIIAYLWAWLEILPLKNTTTDLCSSK